MNAATDDEREQARAFRRLPPWPCRCGMVPDTKDAWRPPGTGYHNSYGCDPSVPDFIQRPAGEDK